MSEIKCMICGCSQYSACYHPDAGPCSWYSQTPPICDHCTDPDIFKTSTRRLRNIQTVNIRPAHIRSFFKVVGLPVVLGKLMIEMKDSCYNISLKEGDSTQFNKLINAHFPDALKKGDRHYIIDLSRHRIRKEAATYA